MNIREWGRGIITHFDLRMGYFLSRYSAYNLSAIQYEIIKTHIQNYDVYGAEELMEDWKSIKREKRIIKISKWINGKHFYALDKKFISYKRAYNYIITMGYKPNKEVIIEYGGSLR